MRVCPRCRLTYPDIEERCFVDGVHLVAAPDPYIGTTLHGRYTIEEKLGETIALWLRSNALAGAPSALAPESLPLLFDRDRHPTPPERALALLESYFRRARRAGRLELADPRSAALAFLASLHSYVALHRVVRAVDPPIPLARFLDTVVEVWSRGAIPGSAGIAGTAAATRPARGRTDSSRRNS